MTPNARHFDNVVLECQASNENTMARVRRGLARYADALMIARGQKYDCGGVSNAAPRG